MAYPAARRLAVIIAISFALAASWIIAMLAMEQGRQSVKQNSNRLAGEILAAVESTATAIDSGNAARDSIILDRLDLIVGGRGE